MIFCISLQPVIPDGIFARRILSVQCVRYDANHSLFYAPNINNLFLIYNYLSGVLKRSENVWKKPVVEMHACYYSRIKLFAYFCTSEFEHTDNTYAFGNTDNHCS